MNFEKTKDVGSNFFKVRAGQESIFPKPVRLIIGSKKSEYYFDLEEKPLFNKEGRYSSTTFEFVITHRKDRVSSEMVRLKIGEETIDRIIPWLEKASRFIGGHK